jgi:hypothetical protein
MNFDVENYDFREYDQIHYDQLNVEENKTVEYLNKLKIYIQLFEKFLIIILEIFINKLVCLTTEKKRKTNFKN